MRPTGDVSEHERVGFSFVPRNENQSPRYAMSMRTLKPDGRNAASRGRILLVSMMFPPTNFIRTRRSGAFAKYLSRMGWDVTVLTTSLDDAESGTLMSPEEYALVADISEDRVLRGPPVPPRRVHIPGEGCWLNPGSRADWVHRRQMRCFHEHRPEIDVIWATYECAGSLWSARAISRDLSIPWIADFRDLPYMFTHVPKLLRWVGMKRVTRICQSAAAWVPVTAPMADVLRPYYRGPIQVITNGYDPDLYPFGRFGPSRSRFRIVYTGTVYRGRTPNDVIRAVQELIATGELRGEKVSIDFYGSGDSWLSEEYRPLLGDVIGIHPFTSAIETARIQMEATILLSLATRGIAGVVSGKLPEYLGAGRPIVSYPNDVSGMDPVLRATGAGLSCGSVAELKAVLLAWYREWQATGDIHLKRNRTQVESWSRRRKAEELSRLCRRVLARSLRGTKQPSRPRTTTRKRFAENPHG